MNQLTQLLIIASRERENAYIEYWREQTKETLAKLTEADTVLGEIRARILAAKNEPQTKGELK